MRGTWRCGSCGCDEGYIPSYCINYTLNNAIMGDESQGTAESISNNPALFAIVTLDSVHF
jgi:hypothetical protein